MSTHNIPIIEIGEIEKHPNADTLGIVRIKGWQTCIKLDQFNNGDKAIFIEPDFNVPLNHPSFSFLKNKNNEGKTFERIRVRKFCKVLSQGLMITVPDELKELPVGTNVIEQLGIERWEPPIPKSTYGIFTNGPFLCAPKFDVESYQNHTNVFFPGERVIATEKIHGANARFVYCKDKNETWKQFVGSRTNWMAEDDKNIWWMAFRQCPAIGEWCQKHPSLVLYGEVFGQVQKLKYGAKANDIFFAGFAILEDQEWINYDDCRHLIADFPDLRWVPEVFRGHFDEKHLLSIAELDSVWPGANHLREGICIIPEKERVDSKIGRVILKMVSNRYLEKG